MSYIHSFAKSQYDIALFPGLRSSPVDEAHLWLQSDQLQLKHLIHPPSNEHGRGFQTILQQSQDFDVYAEGIVVPKGTAVGVRSGDCPVVTGYNPATDTLAITHAGRPALKPSGVDNFNIMELLLETVAPDQSHRNQVDIFISAAICGDCFQHEQPDAWELIDPFRQPFPEAIVGKYGLDLVEVIRQSCVRRGILAENIYHDKICTKEHRYLASHRNNNKERNLTVATHL